MTPPAAAVAAGRARPARREGRASVAPPIPRRVSGPARVRRAPTGAPSVRARSAAAGSAAAAAGVVPALAAGVERLSNHRLIDRLVAGKAWIAVVAFALIGIVTLQLGLLKLNSGIGRSLERQTQLERTNAALAVEDSELAAGDRVEAAAAKLGMATAPSGAVRFLSAGSAGSAGTAAAASALSAPAKPVTPPAEGSTTTSSSSTASKGSESTSSAAAGAGGTSSAPSESSTQSAGGSEAAGGSAEAHGASGEAGAHEAPAQSQAPATGTSGGEAPSSAGAAGAASGGSEPSPAG